MVLDSVFNSSASQPVWLEEVWHNKALHLLPGERGQRLPKFVHTVSRVPVLSTVGPRLSYCKQVTVNTTLPCKLLFMTSTVYADCTKFALCTATAHKVTVSGHGDTE